MRKLLLAVLVLFSLLVLNSAYLGAITYREWLTGESLEDAVYLSMFLGHLVLGVAITLPVLVYGVMHLKRAVGRPNRLAVRLGLALFGCVILLLATGFGLTRGIPFIELRDPALRAVAYWAHVATPVLVGWLFVLHRLAGRDSASAHSASSWASCACGLPSPGKPTSTPKRTSSPLWRAPPREATSSRRS